MQAFMTKLSLRNNFTFEISDIYWRWMLFFLIYLWDHRMTLSQKEENKLKKSLVERRPRPLLFDRHFYTLVSKNWQKYIYIIGFCSCKAAIYKLSVNSAREIDSTSSFDTTVDQITLCDGTRNFDRYQDWSRYRSGSWSRSRDQCESKNKKGTI